MCTVVPKAPNKIQYEPPESGEALASFGISKGLWPSCDGIQFVMRDAHRRQQRQIINEIQFTTLNSFELSTLNFELLLPLAFM